MVLSLTRLAGSQSGLVSVVQLDALGVSEWERHRLVTSRWLVWEAPHVLAVAGAPATWERALRAGLLSLGPDAVVSHRAAAALHGFDRSHAGAVEFTVPRRHRRTTSPFAVHTTRYLDAIDRVTVDGVCVTSATRTVIDLARLRVPTSELEGAIDSAIRLGLSAPVVLAERLTALRGPGRWGCRRLDELLVDSGGHSKLERIFLRLVREAGLPRPRTQVVHRVGGRTVARVDFLFDPFPIVVEVNGRRGHTSPAEQDKDAQRRNELVAIGRDVYEFTWRHATTGGGHEVVRTVRAALVRHGWQPAPPPWSRSA